MRKEDCFNLGHISRKHGYKGEVIAVFDTDRPQEYTKLESVFLYQNGELVPFFIDEIATNSKGHFILKFEDIDSESLAEKLIGTELYLPAEALPPLTGKQFYYHEVIGFKVEDVEFGYVGICNGVVDQTAQPIFQIQNGDLEILVPAIDEFIESIDRDNQKILITTPPGLLELYQDAE